MPRRNTNVRMRRPARRRNVGNRGNEPRFPGHKISAYGPFGLAMMIPVLTIGVAVGR